MKISKNIDRYGRDMKLLHFKTVYENKIDSYIFDYIDNQSGYTFKTRRKNCINCQDKTIMALSAAVTYAPLEIIPGKPFHLEVEIRQSFMPEFRPKCDPESTRVVKSDPRWVLKGYGNAGDFSPGVTIEAFPFEGWARSKDRRGRSVKLEVYGTYNPKVGVPDVTGLEVKKARTKLKAKGLKARMVAFGPAPSNDLSLKVKEIKPKAGSKKEI